MRSIFDNYESMGDDAPLALCPDGQIGAPALGIPCQPIPGFSVPPDQSIGGCPPGQIGWPGMGIPCTTISGVPSSAPPQAPPACPAGQLGWPNLGIPCMPVPTMPSMPNQPVPGVSTNPNVTAPLPPQHAAVAPSGLPSWVLPVAIGGGALLLVAVLFKTQKRSYRPNRRRRHRRK